MRIVKIITLLVFCSYLSACSALQDSSGKVLDNAGSVVKSGSKKMYIKEGNPSNSIERSKEEEEEEFQRY